MQNRAQSLIAGLTLEPATVTAVHGARVDVRAPAFGHTSARLAVTASLRPGDSVLVANGADGTHYVIGVLSALRELSLEDGSRAQLDTVDGAQALRVFDPQGQLVFERHADRTVVHVPDGNLEVQSRGDIAFVAGGELRLSAQERAHIDSEGPIRLKSQESSLELDGEDTRLSTGRLVTTAKLAEAKIEEARLVVGTLRTVAGRIKQRAEVVERTADRVVEKMKESFRDVEGLSHSRAGSVRMVARTTFSVLGQSALLRAKEAVKIRGEKIFLA